MGDLIHRDNIKQQLLERGFYPDIVKVVLEEAPTVDAVPVVRCKDCINYNTDNCKKSWVKNIAFLVICFVLAMQIAGIA